MAFYTSLNGSYCPLAANIFGRTKELCWLNTEGRPCGTGLNASLVIIASAKITFDGHFLAHLLHRVRRASPALPSDVITGSNLRPRSLPPPFAKKELNFCQGE